MSGVGGRVWGGGGSSFQSFDSKTRLGPTLLLLTSFRFKHKPACPPQNPRKMSGPMPPSTGGTCCSITAAPPRPHQMGRAGVASQSPTETDSSSGGWGPHPRFSQGHLGARVAGGLSSSNMDCVCVGQCCGSEQRVPLQRAGGGGGGFKRENFAVKKSGKSPPAKFSQRILVSRLQEPSRAHQKTTATIPGPTSK